MPGKIYIVATPIGNFQDITLRAIEVLRQVDIVVAEEARPVNVLFKRIGVVGKEVLLLNEHNEHQVEPIIKRLQTGESVALISDCGTPNFADPGAALIRRCRQQQIPISPIPGVSSLMATLSILDYKSEQFFFAGFLPRTPGDRKRTLIQLKSMAVPLVILDTPYRLQALLEDVQAIFGPEQRGTLACDLTLPTEQIFRDSIQEIAKKVGNQKFEFVLILDASPRPHRAFSRGEDDERHPPRRYEK